MHIPKIEFSDLDISSFDTVIDVRSPTEFNEDHISQSVNLPVLSDEERALVGKIYKQESRFKARKIGASLIAQNTAKYLSRDLFSKGREWRPLIYCWRGGQRSAAFATILSEIGWRPTLICGGYKNYRSEVTKLMHQNQNHLKLILISGHTGTGKTEVLRYLKKEGLQTINLEALANHRGSVFGAMNEPQPKQKLFESYIYEALISLNASKPIFVEAESRKIGTLVIPNILWNNMKVASKIELSSSISERAVYLTKAYRDLTDDFEKLNRRLDYLKMQQGKERIDYWKSLSKTNEFVLLAEELIINHYDPRYNNSRKRGNHELIEALKLSKIKKPDLVQVARRINELVSRMRL